MVSVLKSKRFWRLVVPVALIFTVLNRYALYFPFIQPEQKVIVQTSGFKKYLNKHVFPNALYNNDFIRENFLLINVSNDIDTICHVPKINFCSDSTVANPIPCTPIINRQRISALFRWLAEHPDTYDIVVCDVIFSENDISAYDTVLRRYILTLLSQQKIVFAGGYDKYNRKFYRSVFSDVIDEKNTGVVNKEEVDGMFFRYRLTYEDGKVQALPMLMYERINKQRVSGGFLGFLQYRSVYGRGIVANNSYIPEMTFTQADINSLATPEGEHTDEGFKLDSSVGRMDLWQAVKRCGATEGLYLSKILEPAYSKKRSIFLGEFSNSGSSLHKTLYGEMTASMILLNIYHDIVRESNKVNIAYHLFIFLFFCFIFRLLFIEHQWINRARRPLVKKFAEWFIEKLPFFSLIAMTLIANIFFGQVTNVIVLLMLVVIIRFLQKHTNNWSFIKW